MKHFKSSLTLLLEEYITYRCSLGYTESNLRPWLYAFDQYVCDKEAGLYDLRPPFFLDFKNKLDEKPKKFNAILYPIHKTWSDYLKRLRSKDTVQIIPDTGQNDAEIHIPIIIYFLSGH